MKKHTLYFSFLASLAVLAACGRVYGKIEFVADAQPSQPLAATAMEIAQRVVAERTDSSLRGPVIQLRLKNDADIPAEGYRISGSAAREVCIEASDGNGFLYGLGAWLHSAEITAKGIRPGKCKGLSVPEKKLRGMYFATHYDNFYHTAPLPEVERYMEDLALWGCNSICVWLDLHHYSGMDDPAAKSMVERLAALARKGKSLGMSVCLATNANEGFSNTPQRLRAVAPLRTGLGMNPTDICPSVPGGTELILKNRRECFQAFIDAGLVPDYYWIFPYDEGGCDCESCRQWGINGFVRITREITAMVKRMMPETKSILSTWGFDCHKGAFDDKGEYAGLAEIIGRDGPWTDFLLADSHRAYPRWFLENPSPAGLPVLNFPEISMHGNRPWGGYGANPQIERLDSIYHEASRVICGGWPYSEGTYEDLNKILYMGFYWNDSLSGKQIARKYVEFYFSHPLADRIMKVLDILEKNYGCKFRTRSWTPGEEIVVRVPETDFGAEDNWKEVQEIDALLPEKVASSWRWRLIYVRAYLDWALRRSGGRLTPEMEPFLEETTRISGSQIPESWRDYLDYIKAHPVSAESIIPKPVKVQAGEGSVDVRGIEPQIICPDAAFADEMKAAGLQDFALKDAYRLEIGPKGIIIRAVSEAGAFYARQTLSQMSAAGNHLACCTVTDWPRFAYRGVMKSMSGIFNPKEYVFRMIDIFSSLKFNVFHLHFTDSRGWRIQSDSYPRLHRYTCWRKSEAYEDRYNFVEEGTPGAYGGYWTKDDVREIVKYAAEHHMDVIPELEMPGHSKEVMMAYPELRCEDAETGELILSEDLCPGREETYRFLEAQIDEAVELFPGKYIHLGGDEAFKTSWKRCRHCRARMEAEGLKTVEELQSYLMKRMCRYVQSKGRKPMGWTEIREGGLPEGVTVTSWIGGRKASAEILGAGNDIVLEPASKTYFCYPQNGPYDWSRMPAGWIGNNISLQDAYEWEPYDGIDTSLPGHLLGVEASLWGVYFDTGTDLDKPFEYYFPRTFATAEVAWSPAGRDYANFRERVLPLAARYRSSGIPCFDIRNEAGPRPESLKEVNHLAKGCRIEFRQPWFAGRESSEETGPEVLLDGRFGGWNINAPAWLGFKEVDFVIDLGRTARVNEVVLSVYDRGKNLVQGPRLWVELSRDGRNFTREGEIRYEQNLESYSASWHMHPVFAGSDARYVRIRSANAGENKFGSKSIFIDEIVVR